MKSVLNRRGSLLDNAPSFLVRQKGNGSVRFATPDIEAEDVHSGDDNPFTDPDTRVTPLRPAAVPSQQTGVPALQAGQIAEIEWLVRQAALATFRTFQSFAYSARMFFYPRELMYYAVLFNEDAVWRVLRSDDLDAAESAFRHFVDQAMRLADADVRRVHLEAQIEQFARLVGESEAHIERVHAELQRCSAQDREVAVKQHEARKEVAQLDGQRIAAQAQLNKLQRQIHQLNATVNDSVPHLSSHR